MDVYNCDFMCEVQWCFLLLVFLGSAILFVVCFGGLFVVLVICSFGSSFVEVCLVLLVDCSYFGGLFRDFP